MYPILFLIYLNQFSINQIITKINHIYDKINQTYNKINKIYNREFIFNKEMRII